MRVERQPAPTGTRHARFRTGAAPRRACGAAGARPVRGLVRGGSGRRARRHRATSRPGRGSSPPTLAVGRYGVRGTGAASPRVPAAAAAARPTARRGGSRAAGRPPAARRRHSSSWRCSSCSPRAAARTRSSRGRTSTTRRSRRPRRQRKVLRPANAQASAKRLAEHQRQPRHVGLCQRIGVTGVVSPRPGRRARTRPARGREGAEPTTSRGSTPTTTPSTRARSTRSRQAQQPESQLHSGVLDHHPTRG